MPRRIAAIDCGTNSIRLLVSETDGQTKTDLVREMRIVRLGEDVDRTGVLASEAVERALAAVREYGRLMSEYGVDRIRFCATSAARDAGNAEEFTDGVEEHLGVRPAVLTGDEEAQLSFWGASHEFGLESALVIDIGGGSSELIAGRGNDATWSTSLDIGSVRMTERYLSDDPPSVDQLAACREGIDAELRPVAARMDPVEAVIGVAGTMTTMTAHVLGLPHYDPDAIHRARLRLSDVTSACSDMTRLTVAERRALPYMHPGRADVIGGGAQVLDRLISQLPLATDQLIVSEHDILDGMVLDAAKSEN